MNHSELGINPILYSEIQSGQYADFLVGRVVQEHKERYVVSTPDGEFDAEITGNLRFSARGREDFPAVGLHLL